MSDMHQHLQGKTDLIANVVASAGIPTAAVTWLPWLLDETGKLVALVYATLGAIYMAKKLFRSNYSGD
jgi:hypothetical protein